MSSASTASLLFVDSKCQAGVPTWRVWGSVHWRPFDPSSPWPNIATFHVQISANRREPKQDMLRGVLLDLFQGSRAITFNGILAMSRLSSFCDLCGIWLGLISLVGAWRYDCPFLFNTLSPQLVCLSLRPRHIGCSPCKLRHLWVWSSGS